MKKRLTITVVLTTFLGVLGLSAQEVSVPKSKAEELHKAYQFDEAIANYNQLLNSTTDSLLRIELENKMILSENGKAMLQFAFTPKVLAAKEYSLSNFFLSYPGFDNLSWKQIPKNLTLDSTINGAVIYYPEHSEQLIYSAPTPEGSWSLYSINKLNDTLWSAPMILSEEIASAGNEIFPILSADGNTLYFSSNGHYGMGGYDLYVSHKDEESGAWGTPQNMGFPYSSTADDYLYYNTPDGATTLFASNRETNSNSKVLVYAIMQEPNPIKKEISESEAREIAPLTKHIVKKESNKNSKETTAEQDNETSQYTVVVKEVRELQQEIKNTSNNESKSRELYNTLTNADDKKALEVKLAELESKSFDLQKRLNNAIASLQKIEMEFLAKGIIINDSNEEAEEKSEAQVIPEFKYANNSLGKEIIINALPPEPTIDLEFKITDEAVEYEISEFPNGLVYQIQLILATKKLPNKSLKGLSPVFARKTSTGKYIYSTGAFRKYTDASSNVSIVRRAGFPTAFVAAYNNGKGISLATAKRMEASSIHAGVYQVVINGVETLPSEALNVIRATTDKDIAKAVDNDVTSYVIGPFSSEEDAIVLQKALTITNITSEIEKVEQK